MSEVDKIQEKAHNIIEKHLWVENGVARLSLEGLHLLFEHLSKVGCKSPKEVKDLCANCDTPLIVDSKIQKAVDKERERIFKEIEKRCLVEVRGSNEFVLERCPWYQALKEGGE